MSNPIKTFQHLRAPIDGVQASLTCWRVTFSSVEVIDSICEGSCESKGSIAGALTAAQMKHSTTTLRGMEECSRHEPSTLHAATCKMQA